jgi:hypothetical protein
MGLRHASADAFFAGLAWEQIAWQGQPLVTGPAGAYVWAYAHGGAFANAPIVFVKTESAGALTVARGGATAVELVEGGGERCRVLDAVPFEARDGATVINATAEMARYWLRVTFR